MLIALKETYLLLSQDFTVRHYNERPHQSWQQRQNPWPGKGIAATLSRHQQQADCARKECPQTSVSGQIPRVSTEIDWDLHSRHRTYSYRDSHHYRMGSTSTVMLSGKGAEESGDMEKSSIAQERLSPGKAWRLDLMMQLVRNKDRFYHPMI